MSEVKNISVAADDDDIRLDRWFKRHYPQISHGQLEKWLRDKNVKVNATRATSSTHVKQGDVIRIPPIKITEQKKQSALNQKDIDYIQSLVIYKDEDIIAINKPAGLAVQGGSKTHRHVDGLLDGLKFGKERPKLVHRLDKETSGVLVLARNAKTAVWLSEAFKTKAIRKVYWAFVMGCPEKMSGKVDAPLLKKNGKNGSESVCVDYDAGQKAESLYNVVDTTGEVSWLEMMPLTGRTHQLRVHCNHVGVYIIADEKYGQKDEFSDKLPHMCLHARAIKIKRKNQPDLIIFAEIPEYLKKHFSFFDFGARSKKDTFTAFE